MKKTEEKGKSEEERIDELVAMLDKMMEEGSGHVNVRSDGGPQDVTVDIVNSTDCGLGACCQPNEAAPEDDEDL